MLTEETLPESSQVPGEPDAPKEQPVDQNENQNEDNTPNENSDQDESLNQRDTDLPPDAQTRINSIGDKVNLTTAGVAVETGAPGAARRAENTEDAFFDSLPIKETKAEKAKGAAGNDDIKSKIETLRSGNLYKAVIAARLLSQNKKNPMASSVSGRANRFLDSTALDVASDLNMIAGSGIGLLTTFDSNPTSKSVFQGMSLVTNLLSIVSTCRNMTVKIRKLYDLGETHKALKKNKEEGNNKEGKKISKIDTTLTVLGVAGDMLTMLVKGVAIIKTIMSMAGKNSKIMNMISNAMFLLTGTTQIIGALNGIRGLQSGYKGLKSLKQETEKPRKGAMLVVERKKNLTAGTTDSWSESECIKAAKEIMNDKQLSEEDKDSLIVYLGMTKRITKAERSLAVTATTLINLTVGLVSTGVSGANTVVNGRGIKDKTLKDATVGMGAVANVSTILTTSAKVANKAVDATGGSRKKFIRQSLWEKVKGLTENHRGLKWLDESLAKPKEAGGVVDGKTAEKSASETYGLYQKTEGQFKAVGVPYAKLIRANSLSKFQDMLVDGL